MADDNDKKVYITCPNCDVSYWVKWSDDDAEPNTCPFCGFDTSIDEEDAIFENEEEEDNWN